MNGDPAARRLAVYGSLSPGGPNHHVLSGLAGRWVEGVVAGELRSEGWGADLGYPGLVLDGAKGEVRVRVFESDELPDHWDRLDAFEGPGYRRTAVSVATDEGEIRASVYVLANEA